MSAKANSQLINEISPWQVLESLGESVAVVDREFRLVWS